MVGERILLRSMENDFETLATVTGTINWRGTSYVVSLDTPFDYNEVITMCARYPEDVEKRPVGTDRAILINRYAEDRAQVEYGVLPDIVNVCLIQSGFEDLSAITNMDHLVHWDNCQVIRQVER